MLILTDQAELTANIPLPQRTLFVAFDRDNAEQLRRSGHAVRSPNDYDIPQCASYDELYDRYAGLATNVEVSNADRCEQERDVPDVWQHVRHKALEVWAPIAYVWEVTAEILSRERPRSISIQMSDWWLRTIMEALADEWFSPEWRRDG